MQIERAGLLRTTRMLARGEVYVPSSVWDGNGTAMGRQCDSEKT